MNLQTYKGKQVAAKKGYDLLKSKADALKVRKRINSANMIKTNNLTYLYSYLRLLFEGPVSGYLQSNLCY